MCSRDLELGFFALHPSLLTHGATSMLPCVASEADPCSGWEAAAPGIWTFPELQVMSVLERAQGTLETEAVPERGRDPLPAPPPALVTGLLLRLETVPLQWGPDAQRM